jgi:hypothetical protein
MARKRGKLKILSDLRKLLARPDTTIRLRRLKVCAHSTWETNPETKQPFNIRLVVDPRRDGIVACVIHELLHVYMDQHLNIRQLLTPEMEEYAVLAWEKQLYNHLHPRHDMIESWSRSIDRKLKEST